MLLLSKIYDDYYTFPLMEARAITDHPWMWIVHHKIWRERWTYTWLGKLNTCEKWKSTKKEWTSSTSPSSTARAGPSKTRNTKKIWKWCMLNGPGMFERKRKSEVINPTFSGGVSLCCGASNSGPRDPKFLYNSCIIVTKVIQDFENLRVSQKKFRVCFLKQGSKIKISKLKFWVWKVFGEL